MHTTVLNTHLLYNMFYLPLYIRRMNILSSLKEMQWILKILLIKKPHSSRAGSLNQIGIMFRLDYQYLRFPIFDKA